MPAPDVTDSTAHEERVCPECGETFVMRAPRQILCGKRVCKRRRERRIARNREEPIKQREEFKALDPKHQQSLAAEVVKEELRPLVRERLTSDVLEGIDALVSLLPTAIHQLEEDIRQKDDPELAHKAAALVMRLTVQNHSVAPPSLEQTPAPLQVHFDIPRPGAEPQAEVETFVDEANAIEEAVVVEEPERQCMECQAFKPESQFVGASDRCQSCDAAIKAKVLERFGPADAVAP